MTLPADGENPGFEGHTSDTPFRAGLSPFMQSDRVHPALKARSRSQKIQVGRYARIILYIVSFLKSGNGLVKISAIMSDEAHGNSENEEF